MSNGLRDELSRSCSTRKQVIAGLLLCALVLAVFPVSFYPAESKSIPEGMVYCPLSEKLQPIKPPETKKEKKPFDALCANRKTKNFLFQEIVLKTPWRVFTLDVKGFENLVFDYLAHGKAALEKLPYTPKAPFNTQVERFASSAVPNNRGDHKFT